MQQLSYFLILGGAIAVLVAANLPGTVNYLRFRRRLALHLSDEELAHRGQTDVETGGLFLSYFVNRRYAELGDAELVSLGDSLRVQLAIGIVAAVAFIGFIAWYTAAPT